MLTKKFLLAQGIYGRLNSLEALQSNEAVAALLDYFDRDSIGD
jgi:hypothetical protein